jgi:hypothetical protein
MRGGRSALIGAALRRSYFRRFVLFRFADVCRSPEGRLAMFAKVAEEGSFAAAATAMGVFVGRLLYRQTRRGAMERRDGYGLEATWPPRKR